MKKESGPHTPQIRDHMTAHPSVIQQSASVVEAFDIMTEHGFRHLPVVDNNKLVGVISDRDIKSVWSSGRFESLKVSEIMSPDPYHVAPEARMSEVLEVMASNKLGCAIIKGHGETVAGIFTGTDAIKMLAQHFRDLEKNKA